jgi:hypothetical protein
MQQSLQDLATKERLVERLKDTLTLERREIKKLQDYKENKAKRLDLLEKQAREFEVMSNVNLSKVVGMLESHDKKISDYKSTENCINNVLATIKKMQQESIEKARKRALEENKVKMQAIARLQNLRSEIDAIHLGRAEGGEVFWREQTQKLFEIS